MTSTSLPIASLKELDFAIQAMAAMHRGESFGEGASSPEANVLHRAKVLRIAMVAEQEAADRAGDEPVLAPRRADDTGPGGGEE